MQVKTRLVQKKKPLVRVRKKVESKEPDGSNLLIVSKKYGQEAAEEIYEWAATAPGFLDAYAEGEDGEPLRVYEYQAEMGMDDSFFIHTDKARQIGFSFGCASDGIAKAHLQKPYTRIFLSINQEEANEKIQFANIVYESLPLNVKKKRIVDNKKSLEFEDHNGNRRSRTRLISHAQREPRGKGNNTDVVLDECAHYIYGPQIYVAAVPIITRGHGQLILGSTPLGKRGIHYTIKSEPRYHKIYSYYEIYWWNCPDLVAEGKFEEAQEKALFMQTEQRVLAYGSDKLVGIYTSMPEDQFQQEYELVLIDETVSYFPLDLIHTCCFEAPYDPIWDEPDEYSEKIEGMFEISGKYPKVDFKLYETLDDLMRAVQKSKVAPDLFAGYDVGRKKNFGELAILEEKGELQIVRFLETFANSPFSKQKEYLRTMLNTFPQMKLGIDNTGMGINLAEDLWQEFRSRVIRRDFTNKWKEEVATDTRIRFESQTIAIPYIKGLIQQIHSIKRKITEHGNFRFDADKSEKHHADKYWAIALASHMGSKPSKIIARNSFVGTATGRRLTVVPSARIIKPGRRQVAAPREFELPFINHEMRMPEARI